MRVLLTGITGNLGFEIAKYLQTKKVAITAVVRDEKKADTLNLKTTKFVIFDLLSNKTIKLNKKDNFNCVVHCAGDVKLNSKDENNQKMMQNVVRIAQYYNIPIFYISTAFVFQGEENSKFNNNYELDKYEAEKYLRKSKISHTIFRPSILVGNSVTGKLINYSGYYILAKYFNLMGKSAKLKKQKVRFPRLSGTSNIIPVDIAAKLIGDKIFKFELGKTYYVTNPYPPRSDWLLKETLKFYKIDKIINLIDVNFLDYQKMKKSKEENILCEIGEYLNPYWSLDYVFSNSIAKKINLDSKYIKKTLTSYEKSN